MLTLKDLRGSAIDAAAVLPRASQDISTTIETVAPILQDVRLNGVSALLEYSEKFDGVRPPSLRVPAEKLREAAEQLTPEVRAALEELILRARAVHEAQLPEASEVSPGPAPA